MEALRRLGLLGDPVHSHGASDKLARRARRADGPDKQTAQTRRRSNHQCGQNDSTTGAVTGYSHAQKDILIPH